MEDVCKMELSMTFAHFHQETGGLIYVAELPGATFTSNNSWGYRGTYCDASQTWGKAYPCAKYIDEKGFPAYIGRGGKQLSYPYNYGPYSRVHYGIEDITLLLNPWLLGSIDPEYPHDPKMLFESAIYFGMVPRGAKPSMHQIATGIWDPTEVELELGHEYGFHATTNVINGGIECGGKNTEQARNRANYFITVTKQFGIYDGWADQMVSPDENCSTYTAYENVGESLQKGHSWLTQGNSTTMPLYEAASPFSIYFPGDYYRSNQAPEGGSSIQGGDWYAGIGAAYDKEGEKYRNDVAYNESIGWVDVIPLTADVATSPVLGNLTGESNTHDSIEAELEYTQGTNSTNEKGTIYIEQNGTAISNQPLITGTNKYTFIDLEPNKEYRIYAEASNDDFSNVLSNEILVTTDSAPLVDATVGTVSAVATVQ